MKVLIVEDDNYISKVIVSHFQNQGIHTRHARDIGSMYLNLVNYKFDFIILDYNLPSGNIYNEIHRIKRICHARIVIFTENQDHNIELEGLELGVDEFVTKNKGLHILLKRIQNLADQFPYDLDENKTNVSATYHFHNLTLNKNENRLIYNEKEISLSPQSANVLSILMSNGTNTTDRDELAICCYGVVYDGYSRGLDLTISRLRKKLQDTNIKIKSTRGVGYSLVLNN